MSMHDIATSASRCLGPDASAVTKGRLTNVVWPYHECMESVSEQQMIKGGQLKHDMRALVLI